MFYICFWKYMQTQVLISGTRTSIFIHIIYSGLMSPAKCICDGCMTTKHYSLLSYATDYSHVSFFSWHTLQLTWHDQQSLPAYVVCVQWPQENFPSFCAPQSHQFMWYTFPSILSAWEFTSAVAMATAISTAFLNAWVCLLCNPTTNWSHRESVNTSPDQQCSDNLVRTATNCTTNSTLSWVHWWNRCHSAILDGVGEKCSLLQWFSDSWPVLVKLESKETIVDSTPWNWSPSTKLQLVLLELNCRLYTFQNIQYTLFISFGLQIHQNCLSSLFFFNPSTFEVSLLTVFLCRLQDPLL